jgi:hypothetical protein
MPTFPVACTHCVIFHASSFSCCGITSAFLNASSEDFAAFASASTAVAPWHSLSDFKEAVLVSERNVTEGEVVECGRLENGKDTGQLEVAVDDDLVVAGLVHTNSHSRRDDAIPAVEAGLDMGNAEEVDLAFERDSSGGGEVAAKAMAGREPGARSLVKDVKGTASLNAAR